MKRPMKWRYIAAIFIVLGIIISIVISSINKDETILIIGKENPNKDTVEIAEKIDISQDINISDKYTDIDNQTEEYQKYLNLSEEEKSKVGIIPPENKVSTELFNDTYFKQLYANKTVSTTSKFDLRDVIGELTVENQGSTNLCWAYTVNQTLQTNLKLRNNESYNFSETYLDYIISNNVYGYRRELGTGGQPANALNIMSVKGAAEQSIIPNGNVYRGDYAAIKNARCNKRVTQYIIFPYVTISDSETIRNEAKDSIKAHINLYGGVITTINAPKVYNGINLRI